MSTTNKEKEEFLQTIRRTISDSVQTAVKDAMDTFTSAIRSEITNIHKQVIQIKAKELIQERKLDQLEQYTRRNNIRIFGVSEQDGEDVEKKVTDILNNKLKITLPDLAVERTHRTGKRILSAHKHRPIIVKFSNYKFKNEVYNQKRALKGSGIVIREDLTKLRVGTLQHAAKKYGYRNVWTRDGDIFVKSGKSVLKAQYPEDLDSSVKLDDSELDVSGVTF